MQDHHLILLAHGSRDPRWRATFEEGLAVIAARLDRPVSLAYMEMASPSLEDVVESAYKSGIRRFEIFPLFFAEGRHLLEDVPAQVRALEQRCQGSVISLGAAAGTRTGFWDFMAAMIAGLPAPVVAKH